MKELNKVIAVKFLDCLVSLYNFSIRVDVSKQDSGKKIFKLINDKKENASFLEKEEFLNLKEMTDKLEIYHNEHIYNSLNKRIEDGEFIDDDDLDLITIRFLESEFCHLILNSITPDEYDKLLEKAQLVHQMDVMKLLNIEEEFYKKVCHVYMKATMNEMIIEKNGKLLHIWIDCDNFEEREEGLINANNYKEYLDYDYGVYQYSCYKELYFRYVEEHLVDDLIELELFNEEHEWIFYMSFDLIRNLGLGYMLKGYYPMIEKTIISNKRDYSFFNCFSLKELDCFEKSLHLYYNENDIKYDEEKGLISNNNNEFDENIILLSLNKITNNDFFGKYVSEFDI